VVGLVSPETGADPPNGELSGAGASPVDSGGGGTVDISVGVFIGGGGGGVVIPGVSPARPLADEAGAVPWVSSVLAVGSII